MTDSLNIFWKDYVPKDTKEMVILLNDLISDKKYGYQVFFSDVYKNTIAAEIKSFCAPYDLTAWQGSSTSYFFVFNSEGKIAAIYSGRTIHYN